MSEGESVQVPVLVEPLGDGSGYVARIGSPFDLSAEAESPEMALQNVSRALRLRLQAGGSLHSLAFSSGSSPSAAGWLPDDDLTREWRQVVEEYRRQCDEEDRRRILGNAEDEKAVS